MATVTEILERNDKDGEEDFCVCGHMQRRDHEEDTVDRKCQIGYCTCQGFRHGKRSKKRRLR
jgi:hypothetical protein